MSYLKKYLLSDIYVTDKPQKHLIREAMDDFQKSTCIKFVPYKGTEKDYIQITSENTGCWSAPGKIGGAQALNLQSPACVTIKGTIIHELMHVIGFLHEQSRFERDRYVTIQWKNIIRGD